MALDAARSSVVLHVETDEGTGQFSIARGVLRGGAFGEASGAMALDRVLEVGASSYQVHPVTEPPPMVGLDGKEVDQGPRLSDLLASRQIDSQDRSGFFMRSRLARTETPLPSDLSELEVRVAERLEAGGRPFDLLSELKAPPEEFLSALRGLVDRGIVSSGAAPVPTSKPFASTLQSEQSLGAPPPRPSEKPFGSTLKSARSSLPPSKKFADTFRTVESPTRRGVFGSRVEPDGSQPPSPPLGARTLMGGSTPFPNVTERRQPSKPPSRGRRNSLSSTHMAGSFASPELAQPRTLRDQAPPEAVSQARALATMLFASSSTAEEVPVPSGRFEPETLEELGGLNKALHSSRRPGQAEKPQQFPSTSSDPSQPVVVVGRYEVLARIKSGGVGSVYLCRTSSSSGFQRLFAMKVLRDSSSHDPAMIREFFREAQVLGSLHHPNIIGIVDVGSETEPYLVLDYVEGGSLFELCQASPNSRDPAVIVTIVLDALAGIAAAHTATDDAGNPLKIVHHDLTPHNLLVGIDGACRVADFGVARTSDSKADEKQYGKPAYVAPERYLGGAGDHRSDLFSLGVVLYTALTGRTPFFGESAGEIRQSVLMGKVPSASSVGLGPPPCFDWVIHKALSLSPKDRFQSAEEMMVQLRRIAAREDLIASPSQVASWVTDTLGERLEQRRKVLRPTTYPPALEEAPEAPPPSGFEVAPVTSRPFSSPPSSYAENEKTEALPSQPAAAPAPPPPADRSSEPGEPFQPPAEGAPPVVLYVAISFVLVILGALIFAPDVVRRLFSEGEPPAQTLEDAPPPKTEPTPPSGADQKDEPEVVIPDIQPATK